MEAGHWDTVGLMSVARYDSVADSYGVGFDVNAVSATRKLVDLVGRVEAKRVLDIACYRDSPPATTIDPYGLQGTGRNTVK